MALSATCPRKNCSFHAKASEQLTNMSKEEKEEEEKKRLSELDCKYVLVGFDSLPEYLKDNEFILNYYRSEWPLKQTILSIFAIHNETLNIWTHLIGFFFFLALTIFTTTTLAMTTPLISMDLGALQHIELNNLSFIQFMHPQVANYFNSTTTTTPTHKSNHHPVTRWPFFAFLFGAMTCLLTSSACHLLACHSKQCCYKMLRLDYTGISVLIVTSFYPVVCYTFICSPLIQNLYIGFITLFGVATVVASLVPVFQTVAFRPVRTVLFVCMAASGLVPIVHKMVLFGDKLEAVTTTGYEGLMAMCYGTGVVVYATRVPERWWPGKFDVVGHSHQLFHVLVVGGAYAHYLAGLEYLKWRDVEGCVN